MSDVDYINKAPHYACREVEPIEIIEMYGLNYRLGNVLKYVLRHELKGGLEDLKKAAWYLNREIEKQAQTKSPLEELTQLTEEVGGYQWDLDVI